MRAESHAKERATPREASVVQRRRWKMASGVMIETDGRAPETPEQRIEEIGRGSPDSDDDRSDVDRLAPRTREGVAHRLAFRPRHEQATDSVVRQRTEQPGPISAVRGRVEQSDRGRVPGREIRSGAIESTRDSVPPLERSLGRESKRLVQRSSRRRRVQLYDRNSTVARIAERPIHECSADPLSTIVGVNDHHPDPRQCGAVCRHRYGRHESAAVPRREATARVESR